MSAITHVASAQLQLARADVERYRAWLDEAQRKRVSVEVRFERLRVWTYATVALGSLGWAIALLLYLTRLSP